MSAKIINTNLKQAMPIVPGQENAMNKRTTFLFRHDGEIWPIVERWASESGYRL